MTLDELKVKAKENGIKVGWTTKNLYKQVADAIVSGETVVAIAEGQASANRVPVVVTESRVYLAQYKNVMGGLDVQTIRRDKIESVGISGSLTKKLVIDTAGGSYEVEKVNPQEAQKIAKILS